MKKYEKRWIQESRDVLVEQRCDICRKLSQCPGVRWYGFVEEIHETEVVVTVRKKDGTTDYVSGSGTEIEIDICPGCFKNKLVPWLVSLGVKLEEKDWNW